MKLLLVTLCSLSILFGAENPPLRQMRIVDYGADMGSGDLTYRGQPPQRRVPYDPAMGGDSRHEAGQTFVSAWPFSMTTPLNPPGLRYNTMQKSAVYYGGLVTLTLNNPERGLSEGHLNANHEFRDDCNFMALQGGAFKPGEAIEAYAAWFWKKENFLNGADTLPVSFTDGSWISVYVSRYWGGVHAARWVVQDGDRFYVSEKTFGNVYQQFTFEDTENPIIRRSHLLKPTESKWALWEPKEPYALAFDHKAAHFEEHQFRDVSAVGFLITRELSPAVKAVPGGLSPNQPIAVKWYAFRCDAVIGDGNPPSSILDTVASGIPNLVVGKTEVSFSQWEKVRSIAVTNQYCRDLGDFGYSFRGDGSMGSMRISEAFHQPNEPVTDIRFFDAVAWCNALSELEGYEPAYYSDAGRTTVYRRTFDRDQAEGTQPAVFWKKEAMGYRLPTQSERQLFASDGASDLRGNLWEYVWPDAVESIDPSTVDTLLAMKGDLSSPQAQETHSGFQTETPFMDGSFNLGFRVARGPTIHPGEAAKPLPTWTIQRNHTISPAAGIDPAAIRDYVSQHLAFTPIPGAGLADEQDFIDPLKIQDRNRAIAKARDDQFLGKQKEGDVIEEYRPIERHPYTLDFCRTEVSYALWNRVRAWALSAGYRFNYPGDMGSMRIATDDQQRFSPDEPVTRISWYDAIAWCNALSELMGKKPCYYTDANATQVFRQVSHFRLETYSGDGYPNPVWKKNIPAKAKRDTALDTLIFFDPRKDGYRLPMVDEFLLADAATEPAGTETAPTDARTHPVRSKPTDATGLQDMRSNVLEWGWDQKVSHLNSMIDYRLNGIGYFYESPNPRTNTDKGYHKEYPGTARSIIGFRLVKPSSK